MKKKLLYAALLAVVAAAVAGYVFFLTPAKHKPGIDNLRKGFASASAEVKAEMEKAIVPIKAGNFAGGVTVLSNLVEKGGLSAEQKQAVKDILVDMQNIVLEKASPDSDTLLQSIADLDSKL